MTNQQIIDNLKLQHNIPTHEPINTFKAWQSLGYQVNKGENLRLKLNYGSRQKENQSKKHRLQTMKNNLPLY